MSQYGLNAVPAGYADWLTELKQRIHAAQQRATLAVNRELILLYWKIGQGILERQASQGWGSKVVEALARDLRNAFPDMKGFFPAQPQIHARIRAGLARRGICARGACTIAVVSPGGPAGQASDGRRVSMVCRPSH